MSRFLYRTDIPDAALEDPRSNQRRQLAARGLLGGGAGIVESISSDPGEQRLSGAVGGEFAELAAAEIEELFASGVDVVPFASTDSTDPRRDGYYALRDVTTRRASSQNPHLQRYTGTLVKKGTRASHWRAVETAIQQVDHPWGNSTVAEVGVPASAGAVRWYDRETQATAPASIVATRTADLGGVAVVDAQSAPYDDPTLIYGIDYESESDADVLAADTKGRLEYSSDGQYQWQRVYLGEHTFEGELALENGLVRVRLGDTLTVEHWDDSAGAWTTTALGTSDWSLARWEVRTIGLAQARARVWFADGSAQQPLDCRLARGVREPQWSEPDGADATPPGLVDLLAPVASERIYHVGPTLGLTPREGL